MRRIPAFLLITTAFLVTLGLLGETRWLGKTRSYSDIKGPIFVVGAFVLAVAVLWKHGRYPDSPDVRRLVRPAAAAVAYLAFVTASVVWASHPWAVKYAVAEWFVAFVLAFGAALAVGDIGSWRKVAIGYVILGVALAVLAVLWPWPYELWMKEIEPLGLRKTLADIKAPQGNANLLAATLVLPIMLTAGLILRRLKRPVRPLALAAPVLGLILFAVVIRYCRPVSYCIGIAVGLTVFAALRMPRPRAVFAAAVFLAVIVLGVAWESGLVGRIMQSKSYIVRAELWRRALLMIEERPILGWGAGNFWTDNQAFAGDAAQRVVTYYEGGVPKDAPVYKIPASADAHVHNEYLQQATEGGIIGLLLYLAVLAVPLASAMAARKRGFGEPILLDAAIAAYAAYLVSNVFNPEVHFADFGPHFWILFGMLAGSLVAAGGHERPARPLPAYVLAAAAVVCACCVYTFAIEDYRSSVEYQRGLDLHRDGDSPAAAVKLKAAADRTWDPLLRVRALYAGAGAFGTRQPDSAFALYQTLSDEIVAVTDTDYRMGRMLENSGVHDKALFYFKRHSQGHKEDDRREGVDTRRHILYNEAMLLFQQGATEEGLKKCRDYFWEFPGDREAWRKFTRRLLGPETRFFVQFDMAIDELLAPGATPEDLVLAGTIEFLRGDFAGALSALEQCVAAGYEGRDGFYFLARTYMELGREDDARRVVARGYALHPTCPGLSHLAAKFGISTDSAPAAPDTEGP